MQQEQKNYRLILLSACCGVPFLLLAAKLGYKSYFNTTPKTFTFIIISYIAWCTSSILSKPILKWDEENITGAYAGKLTIVFHSILFFPIALILIKLVLNIFRDNFILLLLIYDATAAFSLFVLSSIKKLIENQT